MRPVCCGCQSADRRQVLVLLQPCQLVEQLIDGIGHERRTSLNVEAISLAAGPDCFSDGWKGIVHRSQRRPGADPGGRCRD